MSGVPNGGGFWLYGGPAALDGGSWLTREPKGSHRSTQGQRRAIRSGLCRFGGMLDGLQCGGRSGSLGSGRTENIRFPLTSQRTRNLFRSASLVGKFRWGFPLTTGTRSFGPVVTGNAGWARQPRIMPRKIGEHWPTFRDRSGVGGEDEPGCGLRDAVTRLKSHQPRSTG